MDKKSEERLKTARRPKAVAPTPTATPAALSAAAAPTPDWWMYHGDHAHTGFVGQGSDIKSENLATSLKMQTELQLDGPVLSIPAIVEGYIYVGIANSHEAMAQNGGSFYKINIETGQIEKTFNWDIAADERDTHSFTGMGCTPAVRDGKVYFIAFNGKFYCLDQETLEKVWIVDLRNADLAYNQPVTNTKGMKAGYPPAAGWSSPVVVGNRVYVGIGEGENPFLYSFVYCLDAETGNVVWIFCTCQFEAGKDNQPNVLPAEVVDQSTLPEMFTVYKGEPVTRGSSVWSSIAYDAGLNRLFCTTGNPQPDSVLPSPGYSNGLLTLDAGSGEFKGFFQVRADSNYRPSDIDVDVGGSPMLFELNQGPGDNIKAVAFGCKNGGFFVLHASTLQCLYWRQLLPYYNNGTQIPTVDPHVYSNPASPVSNPPTNGQSNTTAAENYSGTFGTPALNPDLQMIYIAIGGPNYHSASPGIDYQTTPFMRALDFSTLADTWPMDDNDPQRYLNASPPMYTNAAECGLSSPAVVNDVVFCSTTKISLYAFKADDGTFLWGDDLGEQTEGYNGGYGYCMGPAVWGNYVVAGALIFGRDGGILRIYKWQSE
ncbi:MAG: PQQ-binding-like beta-propeller repeat protein [Blastocatellia bacterium]|nr:PQQ-binding-like beta-propeller repeat protein [Blastocatellia bacterium]